MNHYVSHLEGAIDGAVLRSMAIVSARRAAHSVAASPIVAPSTGVEIRYSASGAAASVVDTSVA